MHYAKDNTKMDLKNKGTISRKPNGSLEYRIYYYDEYGQKKRKSFCGPNEMACRERAEDFFYNMEMKQKGIDIEATIPDILHEHCEFNYKNNYTHEQGYARSLDVISIIEKNAISYIPIVDVENWQLKDFLSSITHYSESTISKVYGMLKKAYEIAVNEDIISNNPMLLDELRCPKSSKPTRKVSALTVEEEARLINYLNNYKTPFSRNNYVAQIFISLYTGMRMGEVNALKPENVDLNKRIIHVRSTIAVGVDRHLFINEHTKTSAGMRDVPIPKVLVPILEEALAKYKKNKYGLLFYNHEDDSIITTGQVGCFFKRACKKCDIEPRGQHCLRHTFATRCVEAHVDYNVLKTWLGHTDIHVTLDTYTDVCDDFSRYSLGTFDNYMDNVLDDGT